MNERIRALIAKLRFSACRDASFDISRLCVSVPVSIERGDWNTVVRVNGPRIILHEKLFEEHTEDEIRTAFIHGLVAVLLRHEARGSLHAWTAQEKFLWAIASEAARSSFIEMYMGRQLGTLPFIKTTNIAPEKDLRPDASVEEIYDFLLRAREKNPDFGEGLSPIVSFGFGDEKQKGGAAEETEEHAEESCQCESCEGGDTEGGETNDVDNFSDVEENLMLDSHIEASLRDAIRKAMSSIGRGVQSIHGDLQYFSNQLRPDYSDVKRLLKVLHYLSVGGKGKPTITHRRARRSACPDVVLLQYGRKGIDRTAVIADVSGSTSGDRERLFTILVAAINACDRIDLYVGDTAVLEKRVNVHSRKQLQGIPDGGGTDMAAIIEEVDQRGYRNILVVTDGQTPWPSKETRGSLYYFPFGQFTLEGVPEWIKIV